MAIPVKLDFCPRDTGCTCKTVWKDPDTNELYTMRTKRRADKGPDQFDTELVSHICTAKSTEAPTTFFLSLWKNSRTNFERWQGPKRLIRSALIPPTDKKANRKHEWVMVKLYTVTDVVWQETALPEEFKVVPHSVKDR